MDAGANGVRASSGAVVMSLPRRPRAPSPLAGLGEFEIPPIPTPARPARRAVLRVNLAGYSFDVGIAPANPPPPSSTGARRRPRRARRRGLVIQLVCKHDLYYSWRRSRAVCLKCGASRMLPFQVV